jgi:cation/acetate symporter
VTDRSRGAVLERERFDDQLIRAQTGLGAAQAVNH